MFFKHTKKHLFQVRERLCIGNLAEHQISNDSVIVHQRNGGFYKACMTVVDQKLFICTALPEGMSIAFLTECAGSGMLLHHFTERTVRIWIRQDFPEFIVKQDNADIC